MSVVDSDIQLGYKDLAWFNANPTLVLKSGQKVCLEQTGKYKIGDDVTQLQNLSFLGQLVSSVNGETGTVVLTTGDISEDTDKNYVTDAELTVLQNTSGTNTGDETASRIAEINHGTSAKTTLVDADELTGQDSESSFSLIRATCLNVYNYLKAKFDLIYRYFSRTTFGDTNYTVLATDVYVTTSATFTAPRTVTLPSTIPAGVEVVFADDFQTITSTNTLTIAVQSGKTLNGVTNGTEVMQAAGSQRRLFSDGSGNYSFDAGIVRLTKTQTLTNKTLTDAILNTQTVGNSSTLAASTAFVQAAILPLQPIISGQRRTTLKSSISVSAGLQGNIWYVPYYPEKAHTVTIIGINVTIALAATNCKFALYADSSGQPSGAALDFSGDISTATTGRKEYTFSPARLLTDKIYWMAFQGQAGVTFEYIVTAPVVLQTNAQIGWSQAQSYGSFPTPSSLAAANTPPNLYMYPQ